MITPTTKIKFEINPEIDIKENLKFRNITKKREISAFKKKIFSEYKKNNLKIIHKQNKLNKKFGVIGRDILKRLAKLMNYEWDKKEYIGYLSIFRINIYSLKNKSFTLYYNLPLNHSILVTIHEMSHLVFFDKFNSLFKNHPLGKGMFSKEWFLSEVVASIITSDKSFLKLHEISNKRILKSEQIQLGDKNNQRYKQIKKIFEQSKNFDTFLYKVVPFLKNIEINKKELIKNLKTSNQK